MLYIISMVVLTVIAALLLTARRNVPEISADRRFQVHYLASLLKPAGVLILAVMVFITFFASVHQVPAGHIGVVYEFGGIKGQIGEGLQFVAPWRDVLLANIQVQRRVFDKLSAFSEESQDVFVRASLNVRVSPQTIQELYRTVGPNFFNVLVESRVIQNFKDETVKYKSVEIAPNRENIRKAVRERLEKELLPIRSRWLTCFWTTSTSTRSSNERLKTNRSPPSAPWKNNKRLRGKNTRLSKPLSGLKEKVAQFCSGPKRRQRLTASWRLLSLRS